VFRTRVVSIFKDYLYELLVVVNNTPSSSSNVLYCSSTTTLVRSSRVSTVRTTIYVLSS
jgi:hypothetical protein